MTLLTAAALHAALFIMAPLLSTARPWQWGPFAIMWGMPVAIFAYGLLDVINERWGKTAATQTVNAAIIVRAVCWGIGFASGLPVLREAARIALAGELQLLVGQRLVSVHLFHALKGKAAFWARYNVTALVSETVSLGVFVLVANLGTNRPVIATFLGGLMLRAIMSTLLTPVFQGILKFALIGSLLLAPAARADGFRLDSVTRLMASDGKYDGRFEEVLTLRLGRLGVNDLFIRDFAGATTLSNNKLTCGIDLLRWPWLSLGAVYQRQDAWPSAMPGVNRYGAELRITLP